MSIITGGIRMPGAFARSAKRTAIYEYSFASEGGAIGSIPLRSVLGSPAIPSGAIVDQVTLEVLTAPTSGGSATIAVQIEAANDTVNAAAISGAPWSTLGRKAGIPVGPATSLKTTASRTPTAVVATATLTAGIFRVYADYYDPAA